MDYLPLKADGKRVYAGFLKRTIAVFVDALIIVPTIYFFNWLEGFNLGIAIIMRIVLVSITTMYYVWFNARFGGTIGKLAAGISVTKPDGSKIGWREAWKRSSVDILFSLVMLPASIWALVHVD